MSERVAILGAGSWGTALAVHCATIGHEVALVGSRRCARRRRSRAFARTCATSRRSPCLRTLPSRPSSREQSAAPSLVVAAVPSHGLRAVAAPASSSASSRRGHRQRDQRARGRFAAPLVAGDARRGRQRASGCRAVGPKLRRRGRARSADGGRGGIGRPGGGGSGPGGLKGPSVPFVRQRRCGGVEMGGALKNVIAIAAGAVEGLGLGHNAMAALITRGLVEISRLASARGWPA